MLALSTAFAQLSPFNCNQPSNHHFSRTANHEPLSENTKKLTAEENLTLSRHLAKIPIDIAERILHEVVDDLPLDIVDPCNQYGRPTKSPSRDYLVAMRMQGSLFYRIASKGSLPAWQSRLQEFEGLVSFHAAQRALRAGSRNRLLDAALSAPKAVFVVWLHPQAEELSYIEYASRVSQPPKILRFQDLSVTNLQKLTQYWPKIERLSCKRGVNGNALPLLENLCRRTGVQDLNVSLSEYTQGAENAVIRGYLKKDLDRIAIQAS